MMVKYDRLLLSLLYNL